MTNETPGSPDFDERRALSELLPWYAAGTLSPQETARVAAALKVDPTLAEELDIVREDQAASIVLAEAMAVPPAGTIDRILARIDAEPLTSAHRVAKVKAGLVDWIVERFAAFQPRTLAYAGVAAALVLVAQAGIIASFVTGGSSTFQTASYGTAQTATGFEGTFALVGFAPTANAQDISALLQANGATIVDGPRAGGLYRVRIGARGLSQPEIDRILGQFRTQTGVVRFVGPSN
ncbi:MAG: hypothetical protein WCH83_05930 [Alphaproteobacteria bacterium]